MEFNILKNLLKLRTIMVIVTKTPKKKELRFKNSCLKIFRKKEFTGDASLVYSWSVEE
jgi:hypothetical protein